MNEQDQSLVERLREKTGQATTELVPGQQPIATVASMLAAQAKAMVEARFIMAINRPRNWDDVRIRLLTECRRPGFAANKSTYYIKPIGHGVEGLGIRFVEAALRCMTNVLVETTTLHDDERARMLRVAVTDLESNETIDKVITVSKTVERSKPMDDGTYLSVRKNSYGKLTYTVTATDDDILNKEGALVSKAIRVLGLRILPGDIQDECEAIILRIRKDSAAQDPGAERKRIADAFAEINVMPTGLSEYLGHDFGACSPAELVKLRGLYGAVRDGETTWATVMEQARAEATTAAGAGEGRGPATRPQAIQQPPVSAPSPTPEWPQLGGDGIWRDSQNTPFREDLHGWNADEKRPSVTEKGVFRAHRGTGAEVPTTPRTDRTAPATPAAHERASSAQQHRALRDEEGW